MPYFLQPAMPSSPGQRLRREQGLRCMTSFPLCALVRVFCVRPYSTAVCGTGCERSATFWSTKRHPRLLNGSFFPLRGLTRRAFLLQKGGGAQKKAGFFRVFTAAAICGAHIGSMTARHGACVHRRYRLVRRAAVAAEAVGEIYHPPHFFWRKSLAGTVGAGSGLLQQSRQASR